MIDEADEEAVARVYKRKSEVLTGAGALQSRFARALNLFPTGRVVRDRVDAEYEKVSKLDGVKLALKDVEDTFTAWPAVVAATGGAGRLACEYVTYLCYYHYHSCYFFMLLLR